MRNLRYAAPLAALLLASAPALADEVFGDPTSAAGGTIRAAGMPDWRGSTLIDSSAVSAAVTVPLNGAKGVASFQITGLAASGATLTPEFSNDGGTTWNPASALSSGSLAAALTADGPAVMSAAGHTGVRLRVSTAGTGTVSVVWNASTTGVDPIAEFLLQQIAAGGGGSTTGGATAANQVSGNSSLSSIATSEASTASNTGTIAGAVSAGKVQVAGAVGVSSLPSIPAGANAIGSVSISNLPSTQPVSGTVSVGGPLPDTSGGALAAIATNTAAGATAANQTTGNNSLAALAGAVSASKVQAYDANNAAFSHWPTVASGAAFPAGTRSVGYIATGTTTATLTDGAGNTMVLTLTDTGGQYMSLPLVPVSITLGTPANATLFAFY